VSRIFVTHTECAVSAGDKCRMYKWSCALFYFVAVFAVIVDGQPTTGDYDDHSVDRLYESVAILQAKVAVLEAEKSANGPSKQSLVHYCTSGHFILVSARYGQGPL